MVLPLALAHHDVYYYFLLLLIYTTLPCFTRHWVQTALSTIRWIGLFKPFAPKVLYLRRCAMMTVTTARFIWDPGGITIDGIDRPLVPLPSICSMSPIDLTRTPTVKTASTMLTDFLLLGAWLLLSTMLLSTIQAPCHWDSAFRDDRRVWEPGIHRDPFLSRPTRPMVSMFQHCHPGLATASLFHYSHPVLSRPTVPNIDS